MNYIISMEEGRVIETSQSQQIEKSQIKLNSIKNFAFGIKVTNLNRGMSSSRKKINQASFDPSYLED